MKAKFTYWLDCNGAYPVIIWADLAWAWVGSLLPIWDYEIMNWTWGK